MQLLQEAFESRNKKINKIEKQKSLKTYEEAFAQLQEYAKQGYDAIAAEDKSVFFKYFGIFDKEKSNGKNHFMLRVRIPGGQLTPAQAFKVGEVAKKYGNDYIDITTRMQVELRYLTIEDMPIVLSELESVGITTYQTGIDNLRNIVTDPLDGLAYDNVIPCMELIEQMQEVFLKKSDWIGTLPRKFNTAINGSYTNRCNVFSHDCSFVLASKNGRFGFNVYLGGRVGVVAKNADVFVKKGEVVPFFTALIEIFKEYGFRDNRNKNRLHFFIAEVGMQNLVEAIKQRAGMEFQSGGETLVNLEHYDAKEGQVALKDDKVAVHCVVKAGIFSGEGMIEAAKLAEQYGGAIRLSIDQNLYIVQIDENDVESVLQAGLFQKYKNIDSVFFNHMISCAGSDTCSFGVIPGKSDAIALSEYLTQKIKLDGMVRIYWSACVKGCGIHDLGDIGLLGCKAKLEGKSVPGVDIMLGGTLLQESSHARTVLKGVPLEYAKYYLESLMLEYKKLKLANESFEMFIQRVLQNYSYAAIGFMIILQTYLREKHIDLEMGFETKVQTGKIEEFELFDLGRKLYYKLTKQEPYSAVERFSNVLKKEKPEPIRKLVPDIDENLAKIIDLMVVNPEDKRAVVFSEIISYILLYNKEIS
ncbi:MAG: ferredoxin--nitrite reductase [Epsilonproteobacteria bacterium]|nr:ferredoxin--nitrite reductase [Campylobacterota bacterium]